VTGAEFKRLREDLGKAIGRPLTATDMARLCGLSGDDAASTILRWEISGPHAGAAELMRVLAMASERYPILDKFNIFDRHDVHERDRPARRQAFREQIRDDLRRRLAPLNSH
jgi:hypothetical protein